MRLLYDQCNEHDYIYLKTVCEPVVKEYRRILNKEIYACAKCGVEMAIYGIDNPIKLDDEDA